MSGDAVLDGARLGALRDLGLLDSGPEEDFDRFTRLATELLGVPVSLVSLVDSDRQFFKSMAGLAGEAADARQTPLSHSFCQHVVSAGETLVVADAREHPLVADNLAVRDLGVVAYAGVPLVLADGNAVGAFCAIDGAPRHWSEKDVRILEDLGSAVRAQLELRRLLAEQTLEDRLTGLPNRLLLEAQLGQLLAEAGPGRESTVVAICIDLDAFGLVNEAFGVATSERVLVGVAERLRGAVRSGDLLGRVHGDEFAIACRNVKDEREALLIADRLRSALGVAPVEVDGQAVGVTATFGLAAGEATESAAAVLRRAQEAVVSAKRSRRGAVLEHSSHAALAEVRLRMRTELGQALEREEISVAYQPIVDLESGRPVGFEALARWKNRELGQVSAADFIPIAEETGDIIKIGEHVLGTAYRQLKAWRETSGDPLWMSVNISPLQLEQPGFVTAVESMLQAAGLPASALILEITEGVLIEGGTLQVRTLLRLKELGLRIALDDFGTGYSALGYLKRLPIDAIKIDRSFIEGLDSDRHDVALVQAIVTLAHGLDMKLVAEGIETEPQRRSLLDLGVTRGQGYLFARPLPASAAFAGVPPR